LPKYSHNIEAEDSNMYIGLIYAKIAVLGLIMIYKNILIFSCTIKQISTH